MFGHFFQQGSVTAVVLMAYAGNVMIEALRRDRADPLGISSPRVLKSSVGTIFMIASLPCAIWPAIYVGLYDGWLAGVFAWLIIQAIGAIGTFALGIRGRFIGIHFIVACVAYPIGYFVSISSLLV